MMVGCSGSKGIGQEKAPTRGLAVLTLRLPCPSAVNTTAAANATIAPRSERRATLVWNVTTEDALIKFPTLSWDNSTIFLNTNATLLAYRASDGHQLWNTTLAGPITDVGVRPNDSKLLYVTTVRAAAGWERGHGGGSSQRQHPRVESSCAVMPTPPAHASLSFAAAFILIPMLTSRCAAGRAGGPQAVRAVPGGQGLGGVDARVDGRPALRTRSQPRRQDALPGDQRRWEGHARRGGGVG